MLLVLQWASRGTSRRISRKGSACVRQRANARVREHVVHGHRQRGNALQQGRRLAVAPPTRAHPFVHLWAECRSACRGTLHHVDVVDVTVQRDARPFRAQEFIEGRSRSRIEAAALR